MVDVSLKSAKIMSASATNQEVWSKFKWWQCFH